MSLPTPTDLLKGVRNVLFAIAVLVVVVSEIQFGLIITGLLLAVFHHWIIGAVLFVLGLVGRYLNKNIRI